MKTWQGGTEEVVAGLPQSLHKMSDIFVTTDEKVVCVRGRQDGPYFVSWGKEEFGPYDDMLWQSIKIVEEKPLYTVRCRSQHTSKKLSWYVLWGKEEFGPYNGYSSIERLVIHEEKPLFYARTHHFCHDIEYVVWGKKVFGPYEKVKGPYSAHGAILYAARINYSWRVFLNGKRYSDPFLDIDSLQFAEGKPLYIARKENGHFVYWGKRSYLGPHDFILRLSYVDGKPLCETQSGHVWKNNVTQCVFWGKERYTNLYSALGTLRLCSYERKPLFLIPYRGGFSVFWGKERIGRYRFPSHWVTGLTIVADQPFVTIWNNMAGYFYWGKKRYGPYPDLGLRKAQSLFRKLLLVRSTNKVRVIWGNLHTKRYDEVFSFEVKDDHVLFFARVGRKIIKVTKVFGTLGSRVSK